MTPAEITEAEWFTEVYRDSQVLEALDRARKYNREPNWLYVKRVLSGMKHRITMRDYASFSEMTKAKLDKYPHAVTGLEERPPAWMKPWAVRAIYGEPDDPLPIEPA